MLYMTMKNLNQSQIQKQAQKLEYRKDFSKRLSEALDYNGYKQHGRGAQLAREMDVKHESVRRWLLGAATPTKEKQEQMAKTLNVSLQWLMFGKGHMLSDDAKIRTGIAIINHSEIDEWLIAPDKTEENRALIEMPNPNRYLFALRQQGDAMATTNHDSIPDHAILIIDSKDTKVKPGERYIIKLAKYNTSICRLAKKNDTGQIIFASTNQAWQSIEEYNPETDKVYGRIKHVLL